MRVSPAGLLGRDLDEVARFSNHVTAATHDHPEGLKGVAVTATAIFLARKGAGAVKIRAAITETYGYDLTATVAAIRPGCRCDETCQGSVPQALICALEATDFEDAIRNAVSIGGDSDTIAAICGGVAEARFGMPEALAAAVWARLPADMRQVLQSLYAAAGAG
jgi:ADP-ribosyl-[dinitrogen reductase] hydrolase